MLVIYAEYFKINFKIMKTKSKIMETKEIDWTQITDNKKVIRLIKLREKIEEQIRNIDDLSLIKYELQILNRC